MPLVTSKNMLYQALEGGYAIAAFNVDNMEMIQAVVQGAEQENAPVIIQTTPVNVRHAGFKYILANVFAAAVDSSIPIALHLDHGSSYELTMKAMRNGYTSVMIDGSKYVFDENAAITKKVVDAAHINQIPVEAELGRVGGKEDDVQVDEKDAGYTIPDEAMKFVKLTGVDSLAIAIGTAHGIYKGEPVLDFERLAVIREAVDIPLVLHGASGVPDDHVRKAVELGINKVNIATELRIAMLEAIKNAMGNNTDIICPGDYLGLAREAVRETVVDKIRLCGSSSRV